MIGVGAVLFIGIGRASGALMEAAIENRDYQAALQIAKWQMVKTMNGAYPAVAGETAQSADAAFPNFIPTLEVVSIDTDGSYSIRELRVRVRRGTSAGPVLIALYNYRSDAITYGTGF